MKLFTNSKLSIFAALAGLTVAANAATIGVNVGPTGAANEIGSGDSAGVVAQSNWNNLLGGNVAATAVNDGSGNLLATTVQVQTQWSYNTSAGGSGANQTLMNSALDNNGGEIGFVVTGIPYALYDVIIYHEGGSNEGRGGPFFIRDTDGGNAIIATQNSYDVTNFDGTFVDASTVGVGGSGLDGAGDPVNSNYVRFNGLTLANIGVRSDAANPAGIGTDRAPISGFQIVEASAIPEPSSAILALLGLIGFVSRRKR